MEYQEETQVLELPPGLTWPGVPSELEEVLPESVMYEEGVGQQGAQFEWYCAWASQGLASGNLGDLDQLESFKEMTIWWHIDDVGQSLYERIQEGISTVDLTPLREYVSNIREYVSNNCA